MSMRRGSSCSARPRASRHASYCEDAAHRCLRRAQLQAVESSASSQHVASRAHRAPAHPAAPRDRGQNAPQSARKSPHTALCSPSSRRLRRSPPQELHLLHPPRLLHPLRPPQVQPGRFWTNCERWPQMQFPAQAVDLAAAAMDKTGDVAAHGAAPPAVREVR